MGDDVSAALESLRIDRSEEPPPSPIRRWLIWAGAAAAIALTLWMLVTPRLKAGLFATEVEFTEISWVSPIEASVQLTATGYVIPQLRSRVGAKIAGRISQLHVREGDRVKAGALLVSLENADTESALSAAEARIRASHANLATARANLLEIEGKAKRARTLANSGAGAEAKARDLEARVKSLRASVAAALADVRAKDSERARIQSELEYLQIRAPIAGTVISKPASPGELVGVSNPVLEIADFASMLVEVDVPEARLHLVQREQPAEIVLEAYPQKRFRGVVNSIRPEVDRAKAAATVKVRFADNVEETLPNMSARVSFLSSGTDTASLKDPRQLVVPAVAVAERAGAKVVFVADGNKVRMRSVELGEAFANGFVLKNGPDAGARVVKEPAETLRDGSKIKEKNNG